MGSPFPANPLIRENKADTIQQIYTTVDWLCRVAADDEDMHPGFALTLQGVREAVRSLKAPSE